MIATHAPDRGAWRSPALAWAAGLLVAFFAGGLRLLHFTQIPRFTDETDVVVRALAISRGEILPLTDTDGYIGAGFSYVLATILALFGPDPFLPRAVVIMAGVLTVGAAFLLGRELAGLTPDAEAKPNRGGAFAVGLLAALLLAVSPVHILVNSRIAWSHATTPLFTTLGIWLLARAVRRSDGASLAWSGLLFGIALQSHPTAIALAPGAAAWLVWRGRWLLRTRWAAAALGLGAVGCSTLLAYNLLTGFDSVREALAKSDAYALERAGRAPYTLALRLELEGLVRVLAGAIGEGRGDLAPLARPGAIAWAILTPLALAWTVRAGVWLPLVVVAPFLLILPMLNSKYEPLLNGRYLMPIVPLVQSAVALLAVAVWRRAAGASRWAMVAVGLIVVLVLFDQRRSLTAYENAALADGGNLPYVDAAMRIRQLHQPGDLILLDADLGGARVASNREGVSVLEYLLVVHPEPLPVASGGANELAEQIEQGSGRQLLALLPDTRQELAARYRLTPVGEPPAGREQRLRNLGLYRVDGRR